MEIELKTDLKAFTRGMSEVAKKQLPFAMAQALTATAGRVGVEWQDELKAELDHPTPFTINSVAIKPARKADLTARIYIRDIAAAYLEPFIAGGPHFLGQKKGLLTPEDQPVNAYGNIPRGKLASLKARKDVFVGPVRMKSGEVISGVWRRQAAPAGGGRRDQVKGSRGVAAGARTLDLLIRFTDAQQVRQHLTFLDRSPALVAKYFNAEFGRSFNHAMATAR